MKIKDITEGVLSDIYGAYTRAKGKSSPVADTPEYEIPDDVRLDPSTMAKAHEYSHAADKRAYLARAKSQAEIEYLKQLHAKMVDPVQKAELTSKIANKIAKLKDMGGLMISPKPTQTTPATPSRKDEGPMPLYTVTTPTGVKVTKFTDGLWITDDDVHVTDPNDIKRLERLATAQKYSKSASIPKSQMPPDITQPTTRKNKKARGR